MNILKEFAKIFIKSKLDDEKRKLKDKLQKQIITTTSTSVVARNVAYLGIVDKLDGKGIAEVNKIIDKIKVEVISKFKECKIPPTLHILTCTYKNILDKL